VGLLDLGAIDLGLAHRCRQAGGQGADEAVTVAQRIGGPVVLKIVSPDITHKSDIGGVALGLRDAAAVRAAHERMVASVGGHAPQARIDGILVAPMLAGGVECILGAHNDPVFGPMVMFGLGGVFVELLGDVVLHSAPVSPAQALEMIRCTRGFALLAGARGQAPVDLEHLAANLAALSRLAASAGDSLVSIDINPFIALPRERREAAARSMPWWSDVRSDRGIWREHHRAVSKGEFRNAKHGGCLMITARPAEGAPLRMAAGSAATCHRKAIP